MAKEKKAEKISVLGLSISAGICWALITLIAGWAAMFGWAHDFVDVMDSTYIGYEPTFIGALIGAFWALINGFIGGAVIAFFYNIFRR